MTYVTLLERIKGAMFTPQANSNLDQIPFTIKKKSKIKPKQKNHHHQQRKNLEETWENWRMIYGNLELDL